jgi:NADPH-dependent 2,4-dienoyl-CoA reductase/sulfur reductase-like enzyme
MRFVREIVEGIKNECGEDFPMSVRLSIDEFVDGGIHLNLGIEVAKYLESIGVDAINVSCGSYESFDTVIEPVTYEQGWRVYIAEAVKKKVHVPVIAVGVIREPEFAEKILQDNKTDFVAIGRGMIADPAWCEKAKSGKTSEIRKCICCMYCIDNIFTGHHIGCAVNAKAGREIEFRDLHRDGNGKKVVVIGGGPAGMEAARVLAERNFNVILFEKETRLGGQLNYGCKPPGKEKINWLTDYLSHQLKRLHVSLRLGVTADLDTVKAENPYAIFVATGASAVVPEIAGIEKEIVISVQEALANDDATNGQNIAIIGAGMTGCETARLFANNNNHVYLIEILSDIGTGAGIADKWI